MLKLEATRIEYMLKKIRNPLKLKLPPKVTSTGATTNSPRTGATAAVTAAAFGGGLTANAGAVTAAALGAAAMSSSTPVTTPVQLHSSPKLVEEKPIEKSSEHELDNSKKNISKK